MRITKIKVDGLFGIFNHDIPFRLEDRVTIMHGPNGFGKTVILKVVVAFLSGNYDALHAVPFNTFRVELDDGGIVSIERGPVEEQLPLDHVKPKATDNVLRFRYVKHGTEEPSYVSRVRQMKVAELVERHIPELQRVDSDSWLDRTTDEVLSSQDIIQRFDDVLPEEALSPPQVPDWLEQIQRNISVRLIGTERLTAPPSRGYRTHFRREKRAPSAVVRYSRELAHTIERGLADYARYSQSLDRSFPVRLVETTVSTELTIADLKDRLSKLDSDRKRLAAAGLLIEEEEMGFLPSEITIDESNKAVLSVYVEDVEKKLGFLDDLAHKLDLLKSIVNSRFLYKDLRIDKEGGFVVSDVGGQRLPLSKLSSGEQHELVLLYELLFKTQENSLVLVDEPELSLHVAWQQQFLADLIDIARASQFDVLMATHSPQIIHDRWDLTVDLKGPNDENPACSPRDS